MTNSKRPRLDHAECWIQPGALAAQIHVGRMGAADEVTAVVAAFMETKA